MFGGVELQIIRRDQNRANPLILDSFRSLSGIDITWFAPVGNATYIPLEDHVRRCVRCADGVVEVWAFEVDDVRGVWCFARLAPLEAALRAARGQLRADLRPLQDIVQHHAVRNSLADMVNAGVWQWGEDLELCTIRFSATSRTHPPESFEDYGNSRRRRCRNSKGVHEFRNTGSAWLRVLAEQLPKNGGKKRMASWEQPQQQSQPGKQRDGGRRATQGIR